MHTVSLETVHFIAQSYIQVRILLPYLIHHLTKQIPLNWRQVVKCSLLSILLLLNKCIIDKGIHNDTNKDMHLGFCILVAKKPSLLSSFSLSIIPIDGVRGECMTPICL